MDAAARSTGAPRNLSTPAGSVLSVEQELALCIGTGLETGASAQEVHQLSDPTPDGAAADR